MPIAKPRPDSQVFDIKPESVAAREKSVAGTAGVRRGKAAAATGPTSSSMEIRENGSTLKEALQPNMDTGDASASGQPSGIAWNTLPSDMLDGYRVANSLTSPAAFTSGQNQLVLSTSPFAKHSPTMARRKDKRRVSKDHLATAVRKHFNGAAVNELDVVVELAYKARTKGKAFRLRSGPLNAKR